MKTNLLRLSFLFVLLSVMPQAPASFAAGPQNANSSTTEVQTTPSEGNPCSAKCRAAFDRCKHRLGKAERKCLVAYRNCLRRCPQPKEVE